MRLGILADIHEDIEHLALALERFGSERVEQIVFLGDLVCIGKRLGPAVQLLQSASPIGVWGNHDFGLCRQLPASFHQRFDTAVLDFMATLQPRLEMEDCLFTHVEPWLDPNDVVQLWNYEGWPDTPEKAARSFDAVSHRLMFVGHFHRWLVVTRNGLLSWDGSRPIVLAPPERYLVSIAAVCDGRCALFDTATSELIPCQLG